MSDQQDIASFMQQVNEILYNLKAIKQGKSHEVTTHQILNRLPRRFDKIVLQIQFEKTISTLQEPWILDLKASRHFLENYLVFNEIDQLNSTTITSIGGHSHVTTI